MSEAGLASARGVLAELVPVLRRAIALDPASLARIRMRAGTASVHVKLPFGVLAARTIACPAHAVDLDVTVPAAATVAWLDDDVALPPDAVDTAWRSGLPPIAGWQRIDTIPDEVVRGLVRAGALALKEAAAREGVPDAQPRATVADALLDATVLTVTSDNVPPAEISLRTLSALTRMGFLPRGSHIAVDVSGRWIRVAAEYGSVFSERPGMGLTIS